MNLRCEQAVKFFITEKFEFKRFRKELFNFSFYLFDKKP